MKSDQINPTAGDVLAFRLGDLYPSDDPLSEWLVLLATALNGVALENRHLEETYESPYEYLYWLRRRVDAQRQRACLSLPP